MNPSFAARPSLRWPATLVLAFAAVVLLLSPGGAQAATKVGGKATLTLGTGKAGKALKKQRVKLKRVAPAKLKGKKLTAAVRSVSTGPVKVGLKGGFTFRRGKRSAPARGLVVAASGKSISVNAKLAGKKLKLFKGAGKVAWTAEGDTKVTIKKGSLKLTAAAAKTLKKKLKLKKARAGAFGKLALTATKTTRTPVDPCVADPNAEGCQPGLQDPYLAQCGLEATSKVAGTLTPAAPLPNMTGAKALAGSPDIAWGFKDSFRGYVNFVAAGSLHALDGASRDGMGPVAGFKFPVNDGGYKANDPADATDDQAVVNGTGTSVYCATGHGFRIVISDPTVVIDGANSRLVADVDLNMTGVWTPTQRVDLAELDLSETTPFYNRSGSEVTWDRVPASLTADGRKAFCRPAEGDLPEQCLYEEGEPLDPVTVTAKTEGAEPFPVTGYCDDVSAGTTQRIDPDWPAVPAQPLPTGGITGGATVSSGLDWGIRQGMRGMNPYNPIVVRTSADVAWSDPADMSGAGKYFTWTGSSGTHDPAGAGLEDDRLVQRYAGTVGLCSEAHGYGTVLSDPTVVIDGDDSRVSADVAVRVGAQGDWMRGRVDLVDFDADDITVTSSPVTGGTEIKWVVADGVANTSGVRLGTEGAKLIGALNATYTAGAAFQGLEVRTVVPE